MNGQEIKKPLVNARAAKSQAIQASAMKFLMKVNPEFARNMLIEFSLTRAVMMPSVILLIYVLVYFLDRGKFCHNAAYASLWLYGVLIFIWGGYLASQCLVNELSMRTWDFQRMTVIGPWAMAWGKLFGGTVYTWYGGCMAMAVYFICAFFDKDPQRQMVTGVFFLIAGVFIHALAMMFSMMAHGSRRESRRADHAAYFVFTLTAAFALTGFYYFFTSPEYTILFTVKWYHATVPRTAAMIVSVAYFTAWLLVGLYRLMRREFQFPNGPLVWLAFFLGVEVYMAGFAANGKTANPAESLFLGLTLALGVSVFLAYMTAFNDASIIVDYRRLAGNWTRRQWRELMYNLPLWCISLSVTLTVYAMLAGAGFFVSLAKIHFFIHIFHVKDNVFFLLPVLSLLLFMARDIVLILYLRFAEKPRSPEALALVLLLVVYVFIPLINAGAGMEWLNFLFLPFPYINPWASLVPVSLEVFLVFFLLRKRLRKEALRIAQRREPVL